MVKRMTLDEAVRKMSAHRILIGLTDGEKSEKATALTMLLEIAHKELDTVTTKDRFALVTIHGEEYIITDIKMRMLQPRELFNAQGFPGNYIIDHDADGHPYAKSKQVARCGNAVTPQVPAALVRANLPEECREFKLQH